MSIVPGGVETDRQPPLSIPLRHFVVALGFLLVGSALGVAHALGAVSGLARLAHVHLLLVGFVCLTIAGAMTQFVPVWSGTDLHSHRLARGQLWLITGGVVGFAAALLASRPALLPVFGVAMLAGFWTLAYNVGRTLATARPLDITEQHFVTALGFFLLLTVLGVALAVGLSTPLFPGARGAVVAAHATLAVFGAVLTTVFGALYQLVTMFGQTELRGSDHALQRVETVGYPLGVVGLALGRLVANPVLARAGAALLLTGSLAFLVVLARRLRDARSDWTPMLARYALLVPALLCWALLTLPVWLRTPLGEDALFGAPGTSHLLALVVVLVVVGTLYHVVPFLVWVHRYSDHLGFADVPMIDDLYDERLATVDLVLVAGGGTLLVAGDWTARTDLSLAGGVALAVGFVVFAANLLHVLWRHAPDSVRRGRAAETSRDD
ncbi:cbb3-type cytochrome c oxidase subunit I [Haloplanus halobius]|uniref:cbb3-type cytochrome c oxidase subunit I n=1 Tax=Haloplanus halobius TaxID=2934938 RepID=UPI00200EE76F|nr:cbb3-type cytochrome c oxidase subunit I [Haloplanus sp. XH21]